MKADSHKVRVKFMHGNAMSLDLKGCGSIYLEPNREYFFENAPMQFINYLAQLRRLGITYRLTTDKKGCYMTIDLTGYQANEPKTILGQLRSNLVSTPPKITRHSTIKDSEVDESEVPDLIPAGTFKEDIKEISLSQVPEVIEEAKADAASQLTQDDLEDDYIPDAPVTEPTAPVAEEPKQETEESEVKITVEELEGMNKTLLIETAKSVGLSEVSEIWTKKELRNAIIEKLGL